MNIIPRSDGRFEVGDRIFSTEAEAKAYAEGAAGASVAAEPTTAKPSRTLPLWLQIVVGLAGAYLVFSCTSGAGDKAPGASAVTEGVGYDEALQRCKSRISMANGALQNVPRTHNRGTGGEYFFFWENANPGGSPPVEASCNVNKQTGKITNLILNGKSVM